MSHIRQFQTIGAKPEAVSNRFGTLEGIRGWWTEDATGGSAPGERLSLGFGSDRRLDLEVRCHEAGRRIEWAAAPGISGAWRGTRVVCSLEPCTDPLPWQVEGTALRLEHLGFAEFDDETARCNTNWARLLLGFKRMCESGRPSPECWRR